MTKPEALELLYHHSYNHDDLESSKTEDGFLGMLRPFKGELYEDNFHELMTILMVLKDEFKSHNLNRQIISSFWSICHVSKTWALDPDGMLRRNNLITDKQVDNLTVWINCISSTIWNLLDGMDDDVAFESYQSYLIDSKSNL